MKLLIQRSLRSSVVIRETAEERGIDSGLVVFVCYESGDTLEKNPVAVHKISKLRIFSDPEASDQRMSKSVLDLKKEVLLISQFTLSWAGQGGHRPSFDRSLPPELAKECFLDLEGQLAQVTSVKAGVFGAEMLVKIQNDGPVTILLSL